MTSRLVRISLVVASCALVADALAQNPPSASPPPLPTVPRNQPAATQPAGAQPAPNPQGTAQPAGQPQTGAPAAGNADDDQLVSLTLPDADLDTVLSALEIYTGKIVLRPASLTTATYNLNFRKKQIPKSEAILAIETVLALNKIGIAPLGERFLKVVNLGEVRGEAPELITGSAFDRPASGKVATKLFQLEFMRVVEFAPMLQQGILNPYYGQPVQFPNANAIMVTDSISNLQRVEALLQQIDKPVTAGMKPKFYPIRNTKASDLVTKLRTILTGTLQTQLGQATTYSADDRTNQIVLVTDPRQHPFFDELIDKLDQPFAPNTRTEVLYLKHAKAKDVVDVLSRIISGQTAASQKQSQGSLRPGTLPGAPNTPTPPGVQPQPTPAPAIVSGSAATNPNFEALAGASEFSGLMTVVNDERSNAVVVFGTADDIRLATDLVNKLDIVLAQVRIEVVIAEVTLDDNNQSGISALGLKLDGDKLVGFSGSSEGFTVSNGTITRPGTSGGFDLAAEIAINTTPRKSDTTILSVPAIVTSHGKESTFFAGEQRPIVSGTISSAAGVTQSGLATSSQYNLTKIGTNLKVTPFIGIDGSVQLDIKQSVEDVVTTVKIDQNDVPVIGSRETNVYVTAKSGEIIVLGGFQKKIDLKTTNRLGPIPIIGDIFGSRRRDKYRQELVFFLRPMVLTNNSTIDNAETMRRVDQLPTRDQIKQQLDPNYVAPKKPLLDRILPK